VDLLGLLLPELSSPSISTFILKKVAAVIGLLRSNIAKVPVLSALKFKRACGEIKEGPISLGFSRLTLDHLDRRLEERL
jgi:hypothetical protein